MVGEQDSIDPAAAIEPPRGARVLVTGAGGFLGTPCCDLLLDLGVEVHAVSRQPAETRQQAERRRGLKWWQADLLNPQAARQVVTLVAPSHLLHLAWASGVDGFRDSPENFRWLGPGLELLRAFVEAGGRRVVTCGTGAEYDWSAGVCSEEQTPLKPALTYGLCKRAFFELSSRFSQQHQLSHGWGRLFFLYGPGEEPRRLVASAILALLRGNKASCSHSGLRRDYLHVADAAEGLVRLLFSDVEGAINLASGEAPTLGEVVTTVAERIGRPLDVELGGLPTADHTAPTVVADVTRARRLLGWQPRRSLPAGLDQTIEWWRRQEQPAGESADD